MKNHLSPLIVDLHIHSHYSRATSPQMNIASLYRWGKIKGIHVMGTGDFTHPAWFAELREKLEPAEQGLFRLKESYSKEQDSQLPKLLRNKIIRFMLTVEISTIYSKKGKVRKIHQVIVVPSFEAASTINAQLDIIGNLKADGRPILGLDSKKLLKISIESHPDTLFIPAHIWTPWFSMFGSKSGFDSIEETFEELAPKIKAIETGLSSDPYMNWRLSQLDKITLVSNSDAHSPQKLGREANVIASKLTYNDIIDTIKTNDNRFVGTVEFFPQEGKYHYDGHRACNLRCTPQETKKYDGVCPKCKNQLVVGVRYRVNELADRPDTYVPKKHKKVDYIIPLPEIVAEIKQLKGTQSPEVIKMCNRLYHTFGDEFTILRNIPTKDIRNASFAPIATALDKMRKGDVHIEPGYDGVYGVVQIFSSNKELHEASGQIGLF